MRQAPAIAVMALIGIVTGPALADRRVPYTIDVENAAAKVGEKAAVVATVAPPEGFHITKSYRNRVVELSAYEDKGVRFDKEVVLGTIEGDTVIFQVPVTPTEPGEHPINGLIRVGFHGDGKAESKSIPLIATVTGSQ